MLGQITVGLCLVGHQAHEILSFLIPVGNLGQLYINIFILQYVVSKRIFSFIKQVDFDVEMVPNHQLVERKLQDARGSRRNERLNSSAVDLVF